MHSFRTMYMDFSRFFVSLQENQRPPVYNAEDYILSLKKFGRRTSGGTTNGTPKSIYDTSDEKLASNRATTLPAKHSSNKYVSLVWWRPSRAAQRRRNNTERCATLIHLFSSFFFYTFSNRNPIHALPAEECEMSLKQFGSITDLLTKLRADLRVSFPRWEKRFIDINVMKIYSDYNRNDTPHHLHAMSNTISQRNKERTRDEMKK